MQLLYQFMPAKLNRMESVLCLLRLKDWPALHCPQNLSLKQRADPQKNRNKFLLSVQPKQLLAVCTITHPDHTWGSLKSVDEKVTACFSTIFSYSDASIALRAMRPLTSSCNPAPLGMLTAGARSNRPMEDPLGSALESAWAVARPHGPAPTMATSAPEVIRRMGHT